MSNPYDSISADVDAILSSAQQRETERGLSPAKRRQAKRDRKRTKVTLDFTGREDLEQKIRRLAELEDVGLSSLTCWLIKNGLRAHREGRAQMEKRPSRSLKYGYEVVL